MEIDGLQFKGCVKLEHELRNRSYNIEDEINMDKQSFVLCWDNEDTSLDMARH